MSKVSSTNALLNNIIQALHHQFKVIDEQNRRNREMEKFKIIGTCGIYIYIYPLPLGGKDDLLPPSIIEGGGSQPLRDLGPPTLSGGAYYKVLEITIPQKVYFQMLVYL